LLAYSAAHGDDIENAATNLLNGSVIQVMDERTRPQHRE
jgi:hypothetical protein